MRLYFALNLLLVIVTRTHSFASPRTTSLQQRNRQQQRLTPGCASFAKTTTTSTSLKLHDALLASSSASTIMDSLQAIPHLYVELLRTKPLETKSVTAAILATIGDALAQYTSQKSYDPRRGAAFLAFGALYTGCFQHHWFGFLNSHVVDWGETLHIWGHPAETTVPVSYFVEQQQHPWWEYFDIVSEIERVMNTLQAPPSDVELALAKVAINQFLIVPLLYMPLFFAVTGALGGLDVTKSVARARSLYVPLLKRNYLYWLPVQFFQFFVLPSELQVPFVSAASLVWTIVLSSIGGSTAPQVAQTTIVTYEETPVITSSSDASNLQENDVIVTVVPVDAGAVNTLTDNVRLEDVTEALQLPSAVMDAAETVGDALSDPQLGAGASGFAVGLLASAADGGEIASAVGSILGGAMVGVGGESLETSVGVAVVTAVGAGIGYLTAAAAGGDSDKDYVVSDDGDSSNNIQSDRIVEQHENGEHVDVVANDVVVSDDVGHNNQRNRSNVATDIMEVEEQPKEREPAIRL